MRSLSDNYEIALDYAGLGTLYVGPAHKLVGATDGDMGKTVAEWFGGKSEPEQTALYGAVRAMTIKWSKMRQRGDASAEEGEEQSQSDTHASNVSSSPAYLTPNSVQSTLSSATQGTPSAGNLPTQSVPDKQGDKTRISRSKGSTQGL